MNFVNFQQNNSKSHRIHQLIQNIPINYRSLSHEFDKLPEDEYNFNKIKNEIIHEFNRIEIHDCQYNEIYSIILPSMSSTHSQNMSPSRLKCRKCSHIGHLAKNCKSRQQKSSSSYIAELSQDCYMPMKYFPIVGNGLCFDSTHFSK